MHELIDGGMGNGIWQPGRVVAGRYRLDSLIGAGAMGVVWRAADLRLDRVVAVKQLRVPAGSTPEELPRARQQVFREARIAARLQHPLAVAVFDVTTDDHRQPVLIMEYVPSESLASVLADRGALPAAQVARIGADAAAALSAAHEAGILHRDIKPANILLPYDNANSCDDSRPARGSVKITDFGLARTTSEVAIRGLVIGTPAYLAPETARGEPHTAASDVFSLGSTLYAAVEGTPPFGSEDDPDTQLRRVAYGRARPPQQAGPMTRLLLAMLHVDPPARPTMSQVEQVLTVLSQPPETDHPLPVPMVSASRAPRPRHAIAVSAALGLGVLGLVVGTVLANDSSTPSGTQTQIETSTETQTETQIRNGTETQTETQAGKDGQNSTETRTETRTAHDRNRNAADNHDNGIADAAGNPTDDGFDNGAPRNGPANGPENRPGNGPEPGPDNGTDPDATTDPPPETTDETVPESADPVDPPEPPQPTTT